MTARCPRAAERAGSHFQQVQRLHGRHERHVHGMRQVGGEQRVQKRAGMRKGRRVAQKRRARTSRTAWPYHGPDLATARPARAVQLFSQNAQFSTSPSPFSAIRPAVCGLTDSPLERCSGPATAVNCAFCEKNCVAINVLKGLAAQLASSVAHYTYAPPDGMVAVGSSSIVSTVPAVAADRAMYQ